MGIGADLAAGEPEKGGAPPSAAVAPRLDLSRLVTVFRGAPRSAITRPDGDISWPHQEDNMAQAADLVAMALAMTNHLEGAPDDEELRRRALAAVMVWHGLDPSSPPERGFFDSLHRRPWSGGPSGDGAPRGVPTHPPRSSAGASE